MRAGTSSRASGVAATTGSGASGGAATTGSGTGGAATTADPQRVQNRARSRSGLRHVVQLAMPCASGSTVRAGPGRAAPRPSE